MSESGISMQVNVTDGISPTVASLLRAAKDIDPLLDEIGASQVSEVQTRFERQVGPDGKKWEKLSPVTLALRARNPRVKSPKILSVTRTLYDSYTHAVRSGESVTVGSNYRTSRIHNLGGKAGPGHAVTIPARPQLGVSAEGQKEILEIVTDHFGGDS